MMSHTTLFNHNWRRGSAVMLLSLSVGCDDKGLFPEVPLDTGAWVADSDGDGSPDDEDCDPDDASVNPYAAEVCDGVDNNCNGDIDEGVTTTWYADEDGDLFGNEENTVEACGEPDGYVGYPGDCDDLDADINPMATEVCDNVDNNCDGDNNEGLLSNWYEDFDEDGFGDPDTEFEDCLDLTGAYVTAGSDCDDTEADVNPDATEVCDGIDNDCDELIDDEDPNTDTSSMLVWYWDTDGDGYGDSSTVEYACEQPTGYTGNDNDCDDSDFDINPSAREDCTDSIDNDCDGTVDAADTWYPDGDGDGYGTETGSISSCDDESADHSTVAGDCDDSDSAINPDADEECDSVDNDCDGDTDESDAIDASTYYADDDSDGYGDSGDSQDACTMPTGYVSDDTDCDDTDADTNPGVDEYCDGHDDDCDGSTDEADAVDATTSYADTDSDGYGDSASSTHGCSVPSGYVEDATDCDDTDGSVNPDATEVCDSVDNDCDSSIDEGVTSTFYDDADGDGYGDSAVGTTEDCSAPSGYAEFDGDCDEYDANVNPGETEVCGNGIDDDCDGGPGTCGFSGTTSLADADTKWTGEAGDDQAGYDLLGGCDLDDDGIPDVVFGAHENDTGTTRGGAVYIDTSPSSGTASASSSTITIYGTSSSAYFGYGLACGDLNGDGSDDLAVGAYGYSAEAGRIHVFMGPLSSGSLYDSDADMTRTGLSTGDGTGYVIAIGDLDFDGTDDLVVGAPSEDTGGTSAGGVYIEFGPVNEDTEPMDEYSIFLYGASGDEAGSGAFIMDMDTDGYEDLLIGAPGNSDVATDAGAIYVLEGPISASSASISSLTTYTLTGEGSSDYAGEFLMTGDVDSDGYDDLMVGVPNYDDSWTDEGSLYVFLAPVSATDASLSTADIQVIGVSNGDNLGSDAACSDVDGDGYNDLIVGAYGDDSADTDAGTAYVWLGPVSSGISVSSADGELQGEASSDNAGECIAAAGDVDGDGYDDMLICATREDTGGSNAGAVYLHYGTGL